MKTIIIKRPRRLHVFRPFLSSTNSQCDDNGNICNDCMACFAAEAEYNRPGHVWSVENHEVIYMEDKIAEEMLGRPLNPNESVVHRDSNPKNNSRDNLEIVTLPDMETK